MYRQFYPAAILFLSNFPSFTASIAQVPVIQCYARIELNIANGDTNEPMRN